MAITKQNFSIIATGTVSTAGTSTKALPSVTGTAVNCATNYGGYLNYRIANGSAPTTPCIIVFQISPEGTNWFDLYMASGDITANSIYTGSIELSAGTSWVRAIVYGNQVANVTVEASLQAITGI